MSVRVVARLRPLLPAELERDIIIDAATQDTVKIPNPKKDAESYSFHFNSVYDQSATQQALFDQEIAPTVKSLFKGLDVCIFAYGVTGTGKTHTMRGGKTMAERGVIPRLLSAIYRRSRKTEKDSAGATSVSVVMSYYEIYCDRVYDLFEPADKRTPAGLPIRDNGGKTVVVGLTERPCSSLRDFEELYDQANINRSTSATKLNAHSSRSHAILSVKVVQTTDQQVQTSTVSAIDLAGSEDNRRTENGKERMVESAAINKSLFVLAQCVEAITRKQARIPYRESRMTRILSLGQIDGITLMILQLAPVRSYHLDTLSSLNFANRTKKIQVNEIENVPFHREYTKPMIPSTKIALGDGLHRQPLRPKHNMSTGLAPLSEADPKAERNVKSFAVFADKPRFSASTLMTQRPRPLQKRGSNDLVPVAMRPSKCIKTNTSERAPRQSLTISHEHLEALIDRKVAERLAETSVKATRSASPDSQSRASTVQARLEALERRLGAPKDAEQSEGLQFLLLGKQHALRHEKTSALKMFELAEPFFPENDRLKRKLDALRAEIQQPSHVPVDEKHGSDDGEPMTNEVDATYVESDAEDELARALESNVDVEQTPRTKHLLRIINTRDVAQIRLLKGVGAKKADAIVSALCTIDDGPDDAQEPRVRDLSQLGQLRGVGAKGVERMRFGMTDTIAA